MPAGRRGSDANPLFSPLDPGDNQWAVPPVAVSALHQCATAKSLAGIQAPFARDHVDIHITGSPACGGADLEPQDNFRYMGTMSQNGIVDVETGSPYFELIYRACSNAPLINALKLDTPGLDT